MHCAFNIFLYQRLNLCSALLVREWRATVRAQQVATNVASNRQARLDFMIHRVIPLKFNHIHSVRARDKLGLRVGEVPQSLP